MTDTIDPLDAPVLVFWTDNGVLAAFSLEPGARQQGKEFFAAVDAQAVVFMCKEEDPHPTPVYMPPVVAVEFLSVLRFAVGGDWRAVPTTRRELTKTAGRWAELEERGASARMNRRRN